MSLNFALDLQIAAERFRDLPAIICNDVEISYAELGNHIRHWVVMLSRLGVRRGDHVALLMPNVPEFTFGYFALIHLGAVVVPCNTLLTERELAYSVYHSDSKYIIAHLGCAHTALAACRDTDVCMGVIIPGCKKADLSQIPAEFASDPIFWVQDEIDRFASAGTVLKMAPVRGMKNTSEAGTPGAAEERKIGVKDSGSQESSEDDFENSPWPVGALDEASVMTYVSLQTDIPAEESAPFRPAHEYISRENSLYCETFASSAPAGVLLCPSPVAADPGDTTVILYTSGTTGFPKGAMLSQFNLYSNAMFVREHITQYKPGSRTLAILPLYHSFGQTVVQNAALLAGATVIMVPRFDPKKTLQAIEKHRVSVMPAVPTMLIHLAKMQQRAPVDISSLRLIISGGQSISLDSFREVENAFTDAVLIEGYGLSETSPLATCTIPTHKIKPGSIGQEIFGCQVRVMREDKTFAKDGEIGELVIRGHNVMKGYHKNLLATQQAFTNAWFHSGDLAYRDSDGYFYIVDRKKDIIIRAGMNIYPREIEEVLYAHPDIFEAAVVGVPHPLHGEDVIAYISLNSGCEIHETELLKYCRQRLAAYKCPRKFHVVSQLPKGPTGKILKREVAKMAADRKEADGDAESSV